MIIGYVDRVVVDLGNLDRGSCKLCGSLLLALMFQEVRRTQWMPFWATLLDHLLFESLYGFGAVCVQA